MSMGYTNTTYNHHTKRYTIRAYAPRIFQQLRSYYSNDNNSNSSTTNEPQHKHKQSPLSFETSILQRSYTFLKTNSKGSQRSKNIFFYTNNAGISHLAPTTTTTTTATATTKQTARRRTNHQSHESVPNYLIKSIKPDEFDTLIDTILPKYVSYMQQYGSRSLLNRIYGIYEIILHSNENNNDDGRGGDPQRYYLVVFNAVFDPSLTTTTTTVSPTPTTSTPTTTTHSGNHLSSRFRVYDIKGSTIGRHTKTNNQEEETTTNRIEQENDRPIHESSSPQTSVTYKDLDLLRDVDYDNHSHTNKKNRTIVNCIDNSTSHDSTSGALLQVTPMVKEQILQQLRNDVQFLNSCLVMDYSLLMGIESLWSTNTNDDDDTNQNQNQNDYDVNHKTEEDDNGHPQRTRRIWHNFWRRRRGRFHQNQHWDREIKNIIGVSPLSIQYGTNVHGQLERYYLGVIDFLQPYNYKKEIEYRCKSLMYEKNAYSCVPPEIYAQRFIDFIDQHVL